jgi:hypothetical protein
MQASVWTQPPPHDGHVYVAFSLRRVVPWSEHGHCCIAGDCTVSLVYWSQNTYGSVHDPAGSLAPLTQSDMFD